MRFLLDTDWAIQARAGRNPGATVLLGLMHEGVGVSLATVGELYEGAIGSRNAAAQLDQIREFQDLFAVVSLDVDIMYRFAEIRSQLRRRGELIPDFDILIAATALQHDLTLLTYNVRHFRRITGLALYET